MARKTFFLARLCRGECADRLSCWSRLPSSPWERAVREKGSGWTTTLRNADIADYFRRHVLA
ncbi:MAG TPA: hypothetical protein H9894_10355 [Candidatus Desulfovibrio intestinipullorum]|uniref:Uncharacterized protein n=1 Tax=Candidatus Desulfovibrio intestinipullorum TaxID=2838536 RepID=A0A9D1PYD6_9BACT|nr:hypothetical protein [Candidatus Desulfovibrio intestinipullorum]